jgi:Putative peptidoglycan binding domain
MIEQLKVKIKELAVIYKQVASQKLAEFKAAPADAPQATSAEAPQATAAASKNISAPVGEGLTPPKGNVKADVILVQTLLKGKGYAIVPDGDCGKKTITAIREFQAKIFGGKADGVISPGGKTWTALSASAAPVTPVTPPVTPVTPVTPVVPSADAQNVGEDKGDTYLSQRDNPVDPNGTCNVTSAAMQLIGLLDGDKDKVMATAINILKGLGKKAGASDPLEEVLRQICAAKGWSITSIPNMAQLASLFKDIAGKIQTFGTGAKGALPAFKQGDYKTSFETVLKPELEKGAEIIFSTALSGSGHIIFLLAVRSDGILVHDPYGAHVGEGYVRNGDPISKGASFKVNPKDTASRFKYNPALKTEIDALIAANKGVFPQKMGTKNFYSWAEVDKYDIGRWGSIASK